MSTAHVVMGKTGEYADKTSWIARVFTGKTGKARADRFAAKLNKWCADNHCQGRAIIPWDMSVRPADDPRFTVDYTGVRYEVVEAPHN